MAVGFVALAAMSMVASGSWGTVIMVSLASLAHLSATGLAIDCIRGSATT